MLARGRSARLGALLLLGAVGLASLALFVRARSGAAEAALDASPTRPSMPSLAPVERAPPAQQVQREAVSVTSPAATESALDDESPAIPAAREPGDTSEKEFYERFRRVPDVAQLAAEAERILRGTGPDPEKVALLRCLHDRGAQRSDELWLLALRELPDVSSPRGESVPSTVLLLLDRRAPTDPGARATLSRATFEAPPLASSLRVRAAASFFRCASVDELFARRSDLAREQDPLVLEYALVALAHNPNTQAAAALLAPYGRTPAPLVTEGEGAP